MATKGSFYFDHKPLIVKPWSPDLSMEDCQEVRVPIWIQLPNLQLKYWGVRCLSKLVESIGDLIKLDYYTEHKTRLKYARIQIEVEVNQKFPDSIWFINEKGIEIEQEVVYEWKPITCENCKKMGHVSSDCRNKDKQRKVWQPKKVQKRIPVAQRQVDEDGFILIPSRNNTQGQPTIQTEGEQNMVSNRFQALNVQEENTKEGEGMGAYAAMDTGQGVTPPTQYG